MEKTQNQKHKFDSTTNDNQDDIAAADKSKALKYKGLNSVKEVINDEVQKNFPLDVENDKLADYGIGLVLYFEFVKGTAIIFLVMGVIACIAMGSNYTGDGLSDHKNVNVLQKLTLANQPQLTVLTTASTDPKVIEQVNQENGLNLQYFVKEMTQRHLLVSCIDLLYTFVFLVFLIYFTRTMKEAINESQKHHFLPCQFSIIVKGFPSTVTDPEELKQFISQFAEVHEVKIARDYHNTLFLHKEESNLMVKIRIEKMKIGTKGENPKYFKQLNDELALVKEELTKKLEGKTHHASISHDQYPSLQAFVIFETTKERSKFLEAHYSATDLPFYNFLFPKKIPIKNLFQGQYVLEIEEKIANPSNVKWENIEFKPIDRYGRLCLVFFIVFLLMILTFGIIFAANIVQIPNVSECPKEKYTYQQTLTMQETAKSDTDKETIKSCFCLSQSLATLAEDAEINAYCKDIIVAYSTTTGIAIASAFVILIVNTLLKYCLNALGEFIRYASISKEISGTLINLFIVMFINTALITLLLHADIFGFKPAIIISTPIPPLADAQDKNQSFPADLDRDWYASVGDTMVNTWMINIVSPHLVYLILLPIIRWNRERNADNSVIQREMNTWIVGPSFEISAYYAQALNTIFVTFFYCSGMPLMLFLGGVSLATQYFTYKYLLLRFYRKPPAYDHQLHKTVISTLPFAVLLHLLIAIYMYGTPLIFPSSTQSIDITVDQSIGSTGKTVIYNNESQVIASRFNKTPWLSAMLIILIVYYLMSTALLQPFVKFFKSIFHCFRKDNKVQDLAGTGPKKYTDLKAKISLSTLATYEIRANENYRDIIQAMDSVTLKSPEQKTSKGRQSDEENQELVEEEQGK